MSDITKYEHNVWKEEESIPNNRKPLPSGVLVFQIRLRNLVTWFNTTQEDGEPSFEGPPGPMIEKKYIVKHGDLSSPDAAVNIINQALSPLGIPCEAMPPMIRDVSSFVQAAVSSAECFEGDRSLLPSIVLAIAVMIWKPYERPNNEPVAATKSSVEGLEKIRVDDQCMVCLDKVLNGLELTRMPCSHVYHGDCILQWLSNNNFCPFCHFDMSTFLPKKRKSQMLS